ncbi:hypothetical protein HK405_015850, partial [Cladochytrium tenue]
EHSTTHKDHAGYEVHNSEGGVNACRAQPEHGDDYEESSLGDHVYAEQRQLRRCRIFPFVNLIGSATQRQAAPILGPAVQLG